LFNAQSRLLSGEADFQTSIDDFLVTLGLPPNLEVRLSDPLLDAFQLRAIELTELQTATAALAAEFRTGEANAEEAGGAEVSEERADEVATGDRNKGDRSDEPELLPQGPLLAEEPESAPVPEVIPPAPATDDGEARKTAIVLGERAIEELEQVDSDFQALLAAVPERREHLAKLAVREEVGLAQIDAALLAPERLDERVSRLRNDLDTVGNRIRELAGQIAAAPPRSNPERLRKPTDELASLLLELSLLQARARLDTVDIEPTELSDEDALAIASLYRRDWKNARAALVDSWRLVNFNANDLLSDLDITFSGDIGNVGDNPFRLRDTNGRLRVGLEFDGPITRLSERNVYRQSLIEYQQARRDYYQFVDSVSQGLRASLRQVRLNEINFELRREAVLVAIAQVDLTQLRLYEPPRPGEEQQLSNTTARDLVQALSDLLSVQNDFLSVWVNNKVQLWNLELDLGLMELDRSGLRIPLALPLGEFRDAMVCPHEGGPERLPADLQLPPESSPRPLEKAPPLQFPSDFMASEQTPKRASASGDGLRNASFALETDGLPAARRLPTP
ncbi:MAG: TolC family protein, partial [Planctomycetota bacterium]